MPADMAAETGAKGKLRLEPRGSKFQKFQELKLQELAEEVGPMHGSRIQSVLGTCSLPAGRLLQVALNFAVPAIGHRK